MSKQTTAEKEKEAKEAKYNEQADKAIGVMQNYGFLGLSRHVLIKDGNAMNFFKGVLRQHGLTEGEISDVKRYLEENDNK